MSLDNYVNLPYTTILKRDDDGVFIASVKELKGCVAHGDTEVAALSALASMKSLWLESCIADGDMVPLPEKDDENLPSGKWLQRVPRSIHAALVTAAEHEGVSLNQLVVSVLSKEVGRRDGLVETIQAAPEVTDPWSAFAGTHMTWVVKGASPVFETDNIDLLLGAITQKNISKQPRLETHGTDKKTHSWN